VGRDGRRTASDLHDPAAIPSYNVTDVEVTESTGDEIEYTWTDAYEDGVYVAVRRTAWYGTGWYYPPYIYGPIYYPYWGSYGHGSWYNPVTGRYGSRSVWYGPYGGYSYTQGYNPRTGRYGYVEAAWNGQQWASFGETYNPRTGIGVQTERTRDFYAGTSTVERETSRGGSSNVQRSREGGAVSTRAHREVGKRSIRTRQDTVAKAIEPYGATAIEGSGGGEAISVSRPDGDRVTVAESGGGDVYAGLQRQHLQEDERRLATPGQWHVEARGVLTVRASASGLRRQSHRRSFLHPARP
jgi:hypothetical protein